MTAPARSPLGTLAPAATLLFGSFLFGLSFIAMLPPFEGFDETAHYSSIEQIALTGTWPRHGDPIAAEVEDYLTLAPTARAMSPRWSYSDFFAAPAEVQAAGGRAIHAPETAPEAWRPGTTANWEAQHPPLYYLALAPAFRLSAGWSLAARLFLLRTLSYALACLGLGLGLGSLAAIRANLRAGRNAARPAFLLAPVLWPLLMPMWFSAMARLGNDSLVVLLCGALALPLTRILSGRGGRASHLALGTLLGLSLLTKATTLPLAAGVMLMLCWRALRHSAIERRRSLLDLVLAGLVLVALAGWWYLGQALATGNPIGSNDAIILARAGGFAAGFRQHGSFASFLIAFAESFGLSLIWTGTWSFVAPPKVFFLPILAGIVTLAGAPALRLWTARRRLAPSDGLALLTLVLTTAGIFYRSLILFATIGQSAPAWYLHALVPVLSPLLGLGIDRAWRLWPLRFAVTLQLIYAPIFLLIASGTDLLLFAGCAPTPQGTHALDLSQAGACFAKPSFVLARMEQLAFPVLGLVCLAASIVAFAGGLRAALRVLNEAQERRRADHAGRPIVTTG